MVFIPSPAFPPDPVNLRRSSYILPSNAPALPANGSYDLSVSKGILQERCSNRQHDLLDFGHSEYIKHDPTPPIQDVYGYGPAIYAGCHNGLLPPHDEKELDRKAAMLWQRLQQCEPYRKYRARQPQDGGGANHEQKWPDHMEAAFFKALAKYPPMGRRKKNSGRDNKARGRNELIAEAMGIWTGEKRDRKQISSHIQVLKPMVKDDPIIMKYMKGDMTNSHTYRNQRSHASTYKRHTGSVDKMQRYAQPYPLEHAAPLLRDCNPTMPSHHVLDPTATKLNSKVLEPIDFGMFVRNPREDPRVHLHTFTRFAMNPRLSDLSLDDMHQWQKLLPQLASMYTEGALDCHVILVEASISLTTQTVPKGAELGIQFEFSSSYELEPHDSAECRTRFYDDGSFIEQSIGRVTHDAAIQNRIQVPFGSTFWAQKTMNLSNSLREADKRRAMPSEDETHMAAMEELARQLEKRASDAIERLSAVQEIFVKPKGFLEPQKVLVIYWKFKQALRGEVPEATWRNLILPSSRSKDDEAPEPSNMFDALGLDMTANQLPDIGQPFEHQDFDLDALSTMGLAGISTDNTAPALPAEMYPTNGVDFAGGHIQVCMEPSLSMNSYSDGQTFFDPLHQAARPWPTYSTYVDPGTYPSQLYAESAGMTRGEPALASADFLGSPMASGRERGLLSAV